MAVNGQKDYLPEVVPARLSEIEDDIFGVVRRLVLAAETFVRQRYSKSGSNSALRAKGFKETLARADCKPRFVGVWDTVSSVGWVENPLKLPYISNNPDIEIGRHAVALDERRAFFRNHLWRRPDEPKVDWGPRDVKQVWFQGVHCDVGGGYPESESGLAKLALDWMLQEAKAAGLLVDPLGEKEVLGMMLGTKYVKANCDAAPHESLKGAWNLPEFVLKKHYDWKTGKWGRRMNLYRRRSVPPKSLVHDSAYLRKGDYSSRVPADAIRVSTVNVPR